MINIRKTLEMQKAFIKGDYDLSLSLAEKAMVLHPGIVEYHRIRILSLSRIQRHDEAINAAKIAMDNFPGDPLPCGIAVSVAIAAKNFAKCLDFILRLVIAGGDLNTSLLDKVLTNATIQSSRNNQTPEDVQSHLENQIRILKEICFITDRRILLILGNCQVPVLAEILNSTPNFSERWFAYCYKGVHACTPIELNVLGEAVPCVDSLVTQNLFSDRYGQIRTENIRSLFRGKLVIIPTCWFNVTSLDAFRLTQVSGNNYDLNMHSVFMAQAFLDGMSIDKALTFYQKAEMFTKEIMNNNIKATEESLRLRDRELDFSITDYVMGLFTERRLFYSYNHPSLAVLLEVCDGLAKRLNIPFQKENKRYALFDRLVNPLWYTHPRLRKHFGLRYSDEPYFVFNGRKMDEIKFAEYEYNQFSNQDRESLAKDIIKKKQELVHYDNSRNTQETSSV